MYTTETPILLASLITTNIIALIAGLIKVSSRLTKIETDLKWVIKNCNRCQDNK